MATIPGLVLIGDIFCDILVQPRNCEVQSLTVGGDVEASINILPGGSALNATCQIQRILRTMKNINNFPSNPLDVKIISAVGGDSQGKVCLDRIQAAYESASSVVDNRIVVNNEHRTATCVVISQAGERSFLTDADILRDMKLEWFDKSDILSGQHLHCAGFFCCKGLQSSIGELFREARSKGITTSLNPQYDSTNEWGYIQDFGPHLTFLIASEMEAKLISKEDSLSKAIQTLLNWGILCVVITRGSQGAQLSYLSSSASQLAALLNISEYESKNVLSVDSSEVVHISCSSLSFPESMSAVDSTGAGDAFMAGFLTDLILASNHERRHIYDYRDSNVSDMDDPIAKLLTANVLSESYNDKVSTMLHRSLYSGCLMGAYAVSKLGGN